jgi:hypothetical protein
MKENQILGPKVRTAMVEGSWNAMLAIVKMKMEMEYLLPTSSSRSESMEVTDALEMTPLSRRLSEQRRPAMLQRRRSTFRRMVVRHSSSVLSLSVKMVSCSSSRSSRTDSSAECWLGGRFVIALLMVDGGEERAAGACDGGLIMCVAHEEPYRLSYARECGVHGWYAKAPHFATEVVDPG